MCSLSDGVSSGAADDEAEESDNAILDLHRRPFLSAIFDALNVENSDHGALFALSLLYALGHNSGEWLPLIKEYTTVNRKKKDVLQS